MCVCVCVCVCVSRCVCLGVWRPGGCLPLSSRPSFLPFPGLRFGARWGKGASRSGTPGAPAWGPPREQLRPGAEGPARVPGFSPPVPTRLHAGMLRTAIQGLILCGQEGRNIQLPRPRPPKKKKSETQNVQRPREFTSEVRFPVKNVSLARLIQLYLLKFAGSFDSREEGIGSGVRGKLFDPGEPELN